MPCFKYLGHMIVSNITDDANIQCEVTDLFIRTNILIRRFSKCSVDVKTVLFNAYCICLYMMWHCGGTVMLVLCVSCVQVMTDVLRWFLGSNAETVLHTF